MPANPLLHKAFPGIRRAAAGLVAALALAVSACAPVSERNASLPSRHMVAAAHPLAAAAGRDILRAGGSAVDAAVAVQAVLTLVEPQSSGIGGGAFLMHYRRDTGTLDAYDGRETAPAEISPTAFLAPDGTREDFREAARGGRPVGTPGVLAMLALAHGEHGKLSWARLFEPAIGLAREGFQVSPRLHASIARSTGLRDFPAARAYFFDPSGAPRAVGATLKNPALAKTLRRVARSGPAAFYRGDIAADIARAVRSAPFHPGMLSAADLAGYEAKKRPPLCRPYRQWKICGMPPPTSGGVAVHQILGILERFPSETIAPGAPDAAHLFAEAMRLAYADRNRYVGDPDRVAVPVAGLLDANYLRARAALVSTDRRMDRVVPGTPPGVAQDAFADGGEADHPSTSHFSVVDAAGNAVSMTTTVERGFGSYVMVRGFLLNNQLTDFAFRPRRDGRTVANALAPGKRPRSSMSPTLVFDASGRLYAVVGSPGGRRIIAYVARTLIGLLDGGLSMQAAIDGANLAVRGTTVEIEKARTPASVTTRLRALGHEVRPGTLTSGLHGIRVTAAGLDGGADPRREGVALGD